ncbi:hypothetical protein SFB4_310G0, partial [Candidatus Arthromitus sp. SFB-4]
FLDKIQYICESLKLRNDFINANEIVQIVDNIFNVFR